MATKKITLSNWRNRNNRSLYGNMIKTADGFIDWTGGGLTNVVITNVTMTVRLWCNDAAGIPISFAIGTSQLSATLPFTGSNDMHERNAVIKTFDVTGWTSSTFSDVGGSGVKIITGSHNDASGYTWYDSAELTITYYPNESSFSIPSSVYGGTDFRITINTGSLEASHKATLFYNNHSITTSIAAGVKSVTLSFPSAWMADAPTQSSIIGHLKIETIYNQETASSKDYDITVRASQAMAPTFETAVSPNIPSDLSAKISGYYSVLTGVNAVMSKIGGQYGATIAKASISVKGISDPAYRVSANTNISVLTLTTDASKNPLPVSGTVQVEFSATDSRGLTTTATVPITISAFTKPSMKTFWVGRVDAYGQDAPVGTLGAVKADWSIYSLNGINTCASKIYYKQHSSTSWTELATELQANKRLMLTSSTGNITFDTLNGYDIRIDIIDISGTTSFYNVLPSAEYVRVVDKAKGSIGYFTAPEHERSFEINRDVYINGEKLEALITRLIAASGVGGGGASGSGGYYIPNVSADGTLTWTPSNSGMPAIAPANIKGVPGDSAVTIEDRNGVLYLIKP